METSRTLVTALAVALAASAVSVTTAVPGPETAPSAGTELRITVDRQAWAATTPAVTVTIVRADATDLPALVDVPAPPHRVYGASAQQQDMVDWALSRYDEAGLVLPEMDIYFHPNSDGCANRAGLHTGGLARDRIDICSAAPMILLHEMAHGWGSGLSEELRDAFMELRGLDTWCDDTVRWAERGCEHQAHITAWGLLDEPMRSRSLPDSEPAQLSEAFTLLTRVVPLHQADGSTA